MTMHVLHAPRLIEKEHIPELRFPEGDVIHNSSDRKKRIQDLIRANELGDLAQYKVRIYFSDLEGPRRVETTVWNTTKKDVILKYGVTIPIRRISKVVFT